MSIKFVCACRNVSATATPGVTQSERLVDGGVFAGPHTLTAAGVHCVRVRVYGRRRVAHTGAFFSSFTAPGGERAARISPGGGGAGGA